MTEPSWLLRLATQHFGSGDAVFVGLFLLFLATQLSRWGVCRSRVVLQVALACLWLAISGWPELTVMGIVYGLTGLWVLRLFMKAPHPQGRSGIRTVTSVAIFLAAFWEWIAVPTPQLGQPNGSSPRRVAIIGDSLAAGLEAKDKTWPWQLSQSYGVIVDDASHQGATLHTAMQQMSALPREADLLILEIGGNDVLEGVPVATFEAELNALLKAARQEPWRIVLCELPLPPLCNRYGRAQRMLALRYGIPLLSKREFIGILCQSGSTVDGVHLSDLGHARIAAWIATILRASPQSSAPYHRYGECSGTADLIETKTSPDIEVRRGR